jgi:hypothetical protein
MPGTNFRAKERAEEITHQVRRGMRAGKGRSVTTWRFRQRITLGTCHVETAAGSGSNVKKKSVRPFPPRCQLGGRHRTQEAEALARG